VYDAGKIPYPRGIDRRGQLFKIRVEPRGRSLKGYRSYEYPLPKIEEVKKSFKIVWTSKRSAEVDGDRPTISETLPVVFDVAALPRASPEALNKATGAAKRFGCKPPPMNRRHKRAIRVFVRRWCQNNLVPLDSSTNISVEEWIQTTPYSAARKAELLEVWRRNNLGPDVNRERCRVKSFVKAEPYLEPKAARLINSREDYFKVYSGPLFQKISEEVFKLEWFIKTVPVQDRPAKMAEMLEKHGADYFCTDFTSMEAHFTAMMMELIEAELYTYMCKDHPEAAYIMAQILSVLTGPQDISFNDVKMKCTATRMSGEMNTSLGNGFANLMLFLYMCDYKGCGRVVGFVEGDDGIFRVEFPENIPTEDDFFDCGFRIKIITTKELNKASFCGNVFDPQDLVVVSDIKKHLHNVGWAPKKYVGCSRKMKLQLLRAKGFSLAHQYNGCPILGDLGRHLVGITEGIRIRESLFNNTDLYHRQMLREACLGLPERREPLPRTRHLIFELYEITPSDQIAFENDIPNISLPNIYEDTCYVTAPLVVPQVWRDFYQDYTFYDGDPWQPPVHPRNEKQQIEQLRKLNCAAPFLRLYER